MIQILRGNLYLQCLEELIRLLISSRVCSSYQVLVFRWIAVVANKSSNRLPLSHLWVRDQWLNSISLVHNWHLTPMLLTHPSKLSQMLTPKTPDSLSIHLPTIIRLVINKIIPSQTSSNRWLWLHSCKFKILLQGQINHLSKVANLWWTKPLQSMIRHWSWWWAHKNWDRKSLMLWRIKSAVCCATDARNLSQLLTKRMINSLRCPRKRQINILRIIIK